MTSIETRDAETRAPPTVQDVIDASVTLEELLVDAATWDKSYDLVEARRVLIDPTVIILKGRYIHAEDHTFEFSELVQQWLEIVGIRREYVRNPLSKLDLSLWEDPEFKKARLAAVKKRQEKAEVKDQNEVVVEDHGKCPAASNLESGTKGGEQSDANLDEGDEGTTGEAISSDGAKDGTTGGKAVGSDEGEDCSMGGGAIDSDEGEDGTTGGEAIDSDEGGKASGGDGQMDSGAEGKEKGSVGNDVTQVGETDDTGNRVTQEGGKEDAGNEVTQDGGKEGTGGEVRQDEGSYGSADRPTQESKDTRNKVRRKGREGRETVHTEDDVESTVENPKTTGFQKPEQNDEQAHHGPLLPSIATIEGNALHPNAGGEADAGSRKAVVGGKIGSGDKVKEEEAPKDVVMSDGEADAEGETEDSEDKDGGLSMGMGSGDDEDSSDDEESSGNENQLPQYESPSERNTGGKKQYGWTWKGVGSDEDDENALPQYESPSETNTAGEKRGPSLREDTDTRSKRRKIHETPPKGASKGKSVVRPEYYRIPCSQCQRNLGEVCWMQPRKANGNRSSCCQPCKDKKKACTYSAPRKPRTARGDDADEGDQLPRYNAAQNGWQVAREARAAPVEARNQEKRPARAQSERLDRPPTATWKRRQQTAQPSRPLLGNVKGASRMQEGRRNDDLERAKAGDPGRAGSSRGWMLDWNETVRKEEAREEGQQDGLRLEEHQGKQVRNIGKAKAAVIDKPAALQTAESGEGDGNVERKGKVASDTKLKADNRKKKNDKREGEEGGNEHRGGATNVKEEHLGLRLPSEDRRWAVERSEQRDGNVAANRAVQLPSTSFRWVKPGGINEISPQGIPQELIRLREDHVALESRVTELDSQFRVDRRKLSEVTAPVGKAETSIQAIATAHTQDRGSFHEQLQLLGSRYQNDGTEFRATNGFVEEVSKHLTTVESHHATRLQELETKINASLAVRDETLVISKVQDLLAVHRQEVKQDIAEAITAMRSFQQEQQAAIETLTSTVQNVLLPHVQGSFPTSHSIPLNRRPHVSQSARQLSAPPMGWGRSYSENPSGAKKRPSFPQSNSYSGAESGGQQTSRETDDRPLPVPSGNRHAALSAPVGAHQSLAGDQTGNDGGYGAFDFDLRAPFRDNTLYPAQASNLVGSGYNTDFGTARNEITLPPISTIPTQAQDSSSTTNTVPAQSDNIVFQNFTGHQGRLTQITDGMFDSTETVFPPSISQLSGAPSTSNSTHRGRASRTDLISSASRASHQAAFASVAPHPSAVTSYDGDNVWTTPPSPMTEAPSSSGPSVRPSNRRR